MEGVVAFASSDIFPKSGVGNNVGGVLKLRFTVHYRAIFVVSSSLWGCYIEAWPIVHHRALYSTPSYNTNNQYLMLLYWVVSTLTL